MVEAILLMLGLYAAIGALVALLVVAWLLPRLDPAAHRAPVGFRVLIFPGLAVLWPVIVMKLVRGKTP